MERHLATARLHLRPPRAADAPFAFARWASQAQLLRHLLVPHRLDGPCHHLRLGFVLAADWQGCGLMREAVDAVACHALTQPGVWRLDALVAVDNPRSSHLLQCLGWQREGRLACALASPGPELLPQDAWLWATTRAA